MPRVWCLNSPRRVGLLRLGGESLVVFLALLTADSIYHEPRLLRLGLLGICALALAAGVRAVFLARPAQPIPPTINRSWLVHRALLGVLLGVFFLTAALVRPGYMSRQMQRVLLPWREFGNPTENAAQQHQKQREAVERDLLDTPQPGD
jgi:hypothetical protein